jgi:hypothetical protein
MGKNRPKRSNQRRPERITYWVVVEGHTEDRYFTDAKAEFDELQYSHIVEARNKGVAQAKICRLTVECANGFSFENVIGIALNQVDKGHTKIWCVVDADFYARLTGKEKTNAANLYHKALKAGIDVIFSRPCFEVWYRLHFERKDSPWADGKTAKANIAKLWPEYETKPDKHWDMLRGKLEVAIENAEAVRNSKGIPPKLVEDCDASTNVDQVLMDLLFGINPNDPTQDGAAVG